MSILRDDERIKKAMEQAKTVEAYLSERSKTYNRLREKYGDIELVDVNKEGNLNPDEASFKVLGQPGSLDEQESSSSEASEESKRDEIKVEDQSKIPEEEKNEDEQEEEEGEEEIVEIKSDYGDEVNIVIDDWFAFEPR